MSYPRLTSERITQLALELAMVSSQRTGRLANMQFKQLERALRWHRDSCRPLQLARLVVRALLSRRLTNCLGLIDRQLAMLRSVADDCADEFAALEALVALYDALVLFDLGPDATPTQMVRNGAITSTPNGMTLRYSKHRLIASYSLFAVVACWPGYLFIMMAMDDKLTFAQLIEFLIGSIVMAAWLTRGLFKELTTVKRMIEHLNSRFKPRQAPGERQLD